MASTLSILLCSVFLTIFPLVDAAYDKFTALPYCAQYCFTKAVNDSIVTCGDAPLDCFCQSPNATTDFNLCLQANVPCNSNPINNDVEVFRNTVFCNASMDSGFYYTSVPGTVTATVGNLSASVSGASQTKMFSSFPSSVPTVTSIAPNSTSTKCADSDALTAPATFTSTPTVVVELFSTGTSSAHLTDTWIASFDHLLIIPETSGAARAHAGIWESAELGLGIFMTWILVGKILLLI